MAVAKLEPRKIARQIEAPVPQRRRVNRVQSRAIARVEGGKGERIAARLHDFSPCGCHIKGEADWLRLGRFVSIHVAGHPAIQAIVRWTRDGAAGVEFLRPLGFDEAEAISASCE